MSEESTIKKCQCDECVKWGPLFNRIFPLLTESDRELLNAYLLGVASDSDSLGAAESKLAGEWPGWEWMKEAVKEKMK